MPAGITERIPAHLDHHLDVLQPCGWVEGFFGAETQGQLTPGGEAVEADDPPRTLQAAPA